MTAIMHDVVPITWNKRMLTSAGFTYPKLLRPSMKRVARIELATKVLDNEMRLRDTLLHELCHVAAWLLNGCGLSGALKCCTLKVKKNRNEYSRHKPYIIHNIGTPHGTHFKYWAAIARKTYPNMTGFDKCHNYAIHKKWRWRCVNETCCNVKCTTFFKTC